MMNQIETNPLDTAVVGDEATYCSYADRTAGHIISRTAHRIQWQAGKAKLLNGAGSGEPDALKCSPGGFCGHVSGTQRWSIEKDPNGRISTFTRRTRPNGEVVWKLSGHPTQSPGGSLIDGHHHHYEYNF